MRERNQGAWSLSVLLLLFAALACTRAAKDEPEGTTTASAPAELKVRKPSATLEAPPNSPPTITPIPDQNLVEDTGGNGLPFTVGDVETPPELLVVTGSSSNQALVPNEDITFAGTGSAQRQVFPGRVANGFGSTVITLTVSDGLATTMTSFSINVTPVNDPPTISSVANQAIDEDTSATVPFTINDVDSPVASLTLSASSSSSLVPNSGFTFGGAGTDRTVTIAPALNQSGFTTVTLRVSDGLLSTTDDFVLTVNPVNDPPTVSDIADQHINAGGTTGPLSFAISDPETSVIVLQVTGSSSNPTLVPNANIVFDGSLASRTVTVTAAPGVTGTATITVQVSDGALSATDTFVVTVGPVVASVPATPPKWLALLAAALPLAIAHSQWRRGLKARAA